MHVVAALAAKELRVLSKDTRGLANLFLMPTMFLVVMTLALGRAFGPARPGVPNVVQQNVPGWTLFGTAALGLGVGICLAWLIVRKRLPAASGASAAPKGTPVGV